jgi:flagellar protein FlbD
MIKVTRFNGSKLFVNAEMIQSVEGTPDTVITLTNKVIIVVKESPEEIVESVLAYHRAIYNPLSILKTGE